MKHNKVIAVSMVAMTVFAMSSGVVSASETNINSDIKSTIQKNVKFKDYSDIAETMAWKSFHISDSTMDIQVASAKSDSHVNAISNDVSWLVKNKSKLQYLTAEYNTNKSFVTYLKKHMGQRITKNTYNHFLKSKKAAYTKVNNQQKYMKTYIDAPSLDRITLEIVSIKYHTTMSLYHQFQMQNDKIRRDLNVAIDSIDSDALIAKNVKNLSKTTKNKSLTLATTGLAFQKTAPTNAEYSQWLQSVRDFYTNTPTLYNGSMLHILNLLEANDFSTSSLDGVKMLSADLLSISE